MGTFLLPTHPFSNPLPRHSSLGVAPRLSESVAEVHQLLQPPLGGGGGELGGGDGGASLRGQRPRPTQPRRPEAGLSRGGGWHLRGGAWLEVLVNAPRGSPTYLAQDTAISGGVNAIGIR